MVALPTAPPSADHRAPPSADDCAPPAPLVAAPLVADGALLRHGAAHPAQNIAAPAVRLLLGGTAATVQGEPYDWDGLHMFSATFSPGRFLPPAPLVGALDSGAFSDPPHRRLSPQAALERQLAWERNAGARWGRPWQATALVSYDLLIDETWVAGERYKRRWSVQQAERAVQVTVDAARYLAAQRATVAPRTLVLSCQGVDPLQYRVCVQDVVACAQPADWIGLGGWCILGRHKSLLPAFAQTLHEVIPLIADAGVRHVHIFGVLYRPALGWLLWMADRAGLTCSTDSTAPVLACTWGQRDGPEERARKLRKAGVRHVYWRANVAWWVAELAALRQSPYYRCPPRVGLARQLALDW